MTLPNNEKVIGALWVFPESDKRQTSESVQLIVLSSLILQNGIAKTLFVRFRLPGS